MSFGDLRETNIGENKDQDCSKTISLDEAEFKWDFGNEKHEEDEDNSVKEDNPEDAPKDEESFEEDGQSNHIVDDGKTSQDDIQTINEDSQPEPNNNNHDSQTTNDCPDKVIEDTKKHHICSEDGPNLGKLLEDNSCIHMVDNDLTLNTKRPPALGP